MTNLDPLNPTRFSTGPAIMYCAICITVKEGEAFQAITIRGGTAVCGGHIGDARDENVQREINSLPVWEGKVTFQKNSDFEKD